MYKKITKSRFIPIVAMALLLTSCGSNFWLTNVENDDIYGGVPSRNERKNSETAIRQQQTEASVQVALTAAQATIQEAEAYLDNNVDNANYLYQDSIYQAELQNDTFNYDDYYDYEYASRLKRFHEDEYVTDEYYDDYYTNSYWYNNDPFYYGTSIYLGYDWWYPAHSYYRPGWYMGFSVGYPSWGYSPWYGGYPYYGGGYGSGYSNGYWNGYWNGYNDGHYDYCYNPYDRNTYTQSYYGRRRTTVGNSVNTVNPESMQRRNVSAGGTVGGQRATVRGMNSIQSTGTFAEKYESSRKPIGSVSVGGNTGNSKRYASAVQKDISNNSQLIGGNSHIGIPEQPQRTRVSNTNAKLSQSHTGLVGGQSRPITTPKQTSRPVSTRPINTQQSMVGSTPYKQVTPTRRTNTNVKQQTSTPRRNSQVISNQSRSNVYKSTSPSRVKQSSTAPRQYVRPNYGDQRSNSSYTSPKYRQTNSSYGRSTTTPVRKAPTSNYSNQRSSTVRSTSSSMQSAPRSSSSSSSSSRSSSSSSSSARRR